MIPHLLVWLLWVSSSISATLLSSPATLQALSQISFHWEMCSYGDVTELLAIEAWGFIQCSMKHSWAELELRCWWKLNYSLVANCMLYRAGCLYLQAPETNGQKIFEGREAKITSGEETAQGWGPRAQKAAQAAQEDSSVELCPCTGDHRLTCYQTREPAAQCPHVRNAGTRSRASYIAVLFLISVMQWG